MLVLNRMTIRITKEADSIKNAHAQQQAAKSNAERGGQALSPGPPMINDRARVSRAT